MPLEKIIAAWYNIITASEKEKEKTACKERGKEMEKKETEVFFNGVLNCGAVIYGASVIVPEDYTMLEIVKAIKAAGYKAFIMPGMRRPADVPEFV